MSDAPKPRTNQPPLKGQRRGTPGFRSAREFPWTKEEDALLGKMTDREVAGKLNRSVGAVYDRRTYLGKIGVGQAPQAWRMEREPRDRYARLFSTKSNAQIRALLGWSYQRIRKRRRLLAAGFKRAPRWTLEEERLLGTKPDQVLARKFGRPVSAVRGRRRKKRIRLTKVWRPEDDKVLGTRTDHEIALLLGRSGSNVAWRRKKLGILAKAKRLWTAEEEALLGTQPDARLAELFGRTEVAVEARRIQLDRPKPDGVFKVIKVARRELGGGRALSTPNVKPGAIYCTWTPEEDALLAKFTDEEVARKLGCAPSRVSRRRRLLKLPSNNPNHRSWTKEEIALLGTKPDREVAPLVNRSLGNVRYKRLQLGIPFRNEHYEIWKPNELALLGTLPDEEVARRTGHSMTSVRHARTKRGIFSVKRAAPEWRPEEEALLGTAPDKEIAVRLNRTLKAVKHRRAIKGLRVWSGEKS